MTNNAPRLAAFYRQLLSLPPQDSTDAHQFVVTEEVRLAVYDDGSPSPPDRRSLSPSP